MALSYFKRFRMEIDLRGRDFSAIRLPRDFYFVPWKPELLDVHAQTKYLSFCDEIDSNVFPCLSDMPSCRRLMAEIVGKAGFLADATWLVAKTGENGQGICCGTVQGVIDKTGSGSIQNLGVLPKFRGFGLGTALMQRALIGFQRRNLRRAVLEVTAQNSGAVRLYKRLGFYRAKTVYKTVEAAYV
ncbi:MAG: GNAT family N-acetyltransferase [Pirellulales bacterium]|nr:GNAT family N-acetyltransferase [Pirellulales bacterium]